MRGVRWGLRVFLAVILKKTATFFNKKRQINATKPSPFIIKNASFGKKNIVFPDFGNASPLKSPFCKCLKISIGNWANLIDWPILIVLMVFGVHKSHCWRGLRIANLAWKFKFGSYKRISEHQKWLFDHYKNALRHPNHPLLICNILIISIAILEMS